MKPTPTNPLIIEACVTSVPSAIAAQAGGADRVELCDNLYHGGTTPGPGSIILARQYLHIGLNVIIRPRGGDFLYSDIEFEIMKKEVAICGELGVDGIVFGILTANGDIDLQRTRQLKELAGTMSTTFHRAFDMTRAPIRSLHELADLGIDRVLTSGQQASAMAGATLLATLVKEAGDTMHIMPGVGIDASNIATLHQLTGASEYHVHTQAPQVSLMEYQNPNAFMGTDPDFDEYAHEETLPDSISGICNAVRKPATHE